MLKTTRLSKKSALKAFMANSNRVVEGGGGKSDETIKNLPLSKMRVPNIRAKGESKFLTPGAQKFLTNWG